MIRERFAPSPTGHLHLGHAYSALTGFEAAQSEGGEWILRIEDIDTGRAREECVDAIYDDLAWLGLEWPRPVLRQTARFGAYEQALEQLRALGVIYGCACTRKDLALSAPHHATAFYPGTCRNLNLKGDHLNWRLDAQKARALTGALAYREIGQGRDEWREVGVIDDVVLARKDIGTSYHLAVVVDDAHQHITHVTRGADLEDQTGIHVLLQQLLKLPTPIYRHHALILDEQGHRLAKRDAAHAIRQYRAEGLSPRDVKNLINEKTKKFNFL